MANNDEIRKHKVGIVYDTSYLMLDDPQWLNMLDIQAGVAGRNVWVWEEYFDAGRWIRNPDSVPIDLLGLSQPLGDFVEWVSFVPHEVQEEVARHVEEEAGEGKARPARKRIAELLDYRIKPPPLAVRPE